MRYSPWACNLCWPRSLILCMPSPFRALLRGGTGHGIFPVFRRTSLLRSSAHLTWRLVVFTGHFGVALRARPSLPLMIALMGEGLRFFFRGASFSAGPRESAIRGGFWPTTWAKCPIGMEVFAWLRRWRDPWTGCPGIVREACKSSATPLGPVSIVMTMICKSGRPGEFSPIFCFSSRTTYLHFFSRLACLLPLIRNRS